MNSLLFLFLSFFFLHSSLANFDFYMLSHTWPPSFCLKKNCKGRLLGKFTIHGLWPQNNSSPQPAGCTSNYTFKAEDLPAKLKTDWPAIIGDDTDLWKYEWNEHGTCSMLTPNEYFKHSLALYGKPGKNIKDILAKAKIKAGEELVKRTDIEAAIKNHIKKEPQIVCDPTKEYLLEIRICYDKSDNYKDCASYTTSCNEEVRYPYRIKL
ncbi:putative ribonuclease T(2) [Medicago truncatula]|uniref:Putative ribonuclease T(2) n=1 Tax=Medicago truncatula TaxID=3880 RepID=A0A072UVX3_MEDTR|nr:ribonuclease DdI [Medicago truncatula]KEH30000.1 ribonuclease T2 family protein [Medicago truncatula]RHN60685.1 putative ribonuclease T(2) [Medicago truncatula]